MSMGPKGCQPDPSNKYQCECYDTPVPGHKVKGKCVATFNCKGDSGTGLDGAMQGIQQLMGLMEKLMKGGGGGGGGGGGEQGQQQQAAANTGCSQYYQVTVPSSDPCAYYVPPTSASLSTNTLDSSAANTLLGALDGSSELSSALGGELAVPSNVSDIIDTSESGTGSANTSVQTQTGSQAQAQTGAAGDLSGQSANLQPSTQGDIQVSGTGATVVANARDPQSNTEIAGFYGSDTFGGSQPQGLVATMCQSRPWSNSVVSFIIPPSFFDSLCAWRGYTVGSPAPVAPTQTQTTLQQQPQQQVSQSTQQQPQQQAGEVDPEVDIWAVPTSVPLGARTSIFWNSSGVESCVLSSSDGSFSEDERSGGASTVALSGETTFTIKCTAEDGTEVTDKTIVNIAI